MIVLLESPQPCAHVMSDGQPCRHPADVALIVDIDGCPRGAVNIALCKTCVLAALLAYRRYALKFVETMDID